MDTTVAWDHMKGTVDKLAAAFQALLDGPQEVVCSLDFEEAEALAEVFEAGEHVDVAVRLMHRWALTEPDWADEHGERVRHWLAIEHARLEDSRQAA